MVQGHLIFGFLTHFFIRKIQWAGCLLLCMRSGEVIVFFGWVLCFLDRIVDLTHYKS